MSDGGHSSQPATVTILKCGRCGKRWRNSGPLMVRDEHTRRYREATREERREYWEPDCACRPFDPKVETVRVSE